MKVFPRRLGVVLKIMATSALLVAFGSGAWAADAKTKITFMSPLAGADGSYMDKIIQGFNAANPDVEVTHLVVGDSTEYKQKFSTAVSTNTAPEVLMIRKFDMPLYMNRFTGFTADDYKKYGIDIADVFPNLMTGLDYKGKFVGFPLDVWIFYQAYNKANFKKAGLDPNKPPMTLDEFIKAMEALKKNTPKGVTPYYETVTWTWIWSQYLWQFGGDLLTPDFKHPAFKEAGIKVLNMLLDLQKRGIIPNAAVDAGAAFESGNSSVLITGIWTINPWSTLFKGDFGYAAVPQFGNTKAVFGGSHVIAVTDAMVKDPKKKDAAMRWVKYLWDHMLDWYGAGQTPSRKSIASSAELKTKLPAIYTVAQQASYVKSFQMFPNISEVQGELGVYLEGALFTKEMTPEVAMTKAEAAVQTLLDDYWAAH